MFNGLNHILIVLIMEVDILIFMMNGPTSNILLLFMMVMMKQFMYN